MLLAEAFAFSSREFPSSFASASLADAWQHSKIFKDGFSRGH